VPTTLPRNSIVARIAALVCDTTYTVDVCVRRNVSQRDGVDTVMYCVFVDEASTAKVPGALAVLAGGEDLVWFYDFHAAMQRATDEAKALILGM
jgi:hypothetical protein